MAEAEAEAVAATATEAELKSCKRAFYARNMQKFNKLNELQFVQQMQQQLQQQQSEQLQQQKPVQLCNNKCHKYVVKSSVQQATPVGFIKQLTQFNIHVGELPKFDYFINTRTHT